MPMPALKHESYRACCAKKSSRQHLANSVKFTAAKYGADFRQSTKPLSPRSVACYVTISGYECMIFFDGSSRADAFLGHWHRVDTDAPELPRVFPGTGPSGYPNLPRHKATICEDTLGGFMKALDAGLACLARSSAGQRA